MGLQVWLPLNGNLNNQGLANVSVTSGTAKYKTGKIGNGLDLSSRIMFSCPKLVGLKQFTIMFWVKIEDDDSIASNWQDIFGIYEQKADGSSYGQFRAETYYTPKTVGFLGVHWHDNANYGITSGTLPTHYTGDRGVWHHCAIVVDSDQFIKSYTDGVLKNEYTTGLEGGHLYNGVFWLGETNNIAGCVNDVRIYDHVLSPREVKEISKGLVLHYPLSMPGQENLYTGSRDFSGTWVNGANWVTDSEQYNGFVVKKKNSIWGGLAQNVPCSSGDIFTISFYAKVDSGGNILSVHRSSLGNVTTGLTILGGNFTSGTDWVTASQTATSWKKYWATVQITSTDITYLQWRIENSVANKFLYVCGMKLERGSRPTPWLPNPADTKYAALGFNDGIEYDISGYNHNGTKYGVITYDADTPRYKTSAVFNGSSDIRSAKSSFGWFDFKEGTVAAWFKPANTTQRWASVGVQNDAGAGWRSFSICNYSGKAATVVGYNSSLGSSSSGYSMAANTWYHLCATITNGDTVKLYMNGELVQTRTVTNTTGTIASTTQFAVGVDLPGSDERFTGQLSDVRFYTTCLNESDVRDLYAVGASLSDTGVLFSNEVSEV